MDVSQYFNMDMIEEIENRHFLHWNFRGLTKLPIEFFYHGLHIQDLYLKSNNLQKLPLWIHKMKNLRNLYLYENQICELPANIGSLKSLTTLDLQNNCLTLLPSSIGELRHLQILNLQFNYIREIPPEVQKLKSLILLNLKQNDLHHVDEFICKLNSLREIILDNNKIFSLPNSIVYMPNLVYLSIEGNRLQYLPLVKFQNKTMISLSRNPYLNYISYDLGCFMTSHSSMTVNDNLWHFDCTGCFQKRVEYSTCMLAEVPTAEASLVLPRGLAKIYPAHTSFVPTLLELSLRAVYTINFTTDDIRRCTSKNCIDSLPSTLNSRLWDGPIAQCQLCACPIFSECILWIFSRNMISFKREEPDRLFSVVCFCSCVCSKTYQWNENCFIGPNENLNNYIHHWTVP